MDKIIKKLKENGACQVDIEFIKDDFEITVWVRGDGYTDGFSVMRDDLEEALNVALEELIEENKEG